MKNDPKRWPVHCCMLLKDTRLQSQSITYRQLLHVRAHWDCTWERTESGYRATRKHLKHT